MGYALEAIARQLGDPGDGIFRETAWIEASWRRPDTFLRALLRYHAALDPASVKSTPQAGFDLYHDLVLRHADRGRTAFVSLADGRPRAVSFSALHALCSECRAAWLGRGVRPGDSLCVLAPLGLELVVPLLTGLRLGLQVTLLPPLGPAFLDQRLAACRPRWVAAARRYGPLLRALDPAQLLGEIPVEPAAQPQPADATSHTYGGDDPALQLFSPLHTPPDAPIEVSAADAYGGALRDGLLLLGLRPGQVVAAPGADAGQPLLQTQPALLLATLLCGATFLHLGIGDLRRDPRRDEPLSAAPRVDVLLVRDALRTALREGLPRALGRGLRLWVRSPQEAQEPLAWTEWAERSGLTGTPAMALLLDAACGGSVLFSQRRLGAPPAYLMPSPGRPFTLQQPDGGDPARAAYGTFQPAPTATGLLLTRIEGGYLYAGTRTPTCAGQVYPAAEVERAVQDLPFVRGAAVVQAPGDRSRPTLLVFTGPETRSYAEAALARRSVLLRSAIHQRISPEFVPAEMLVLAMLPRLTGTGQVDPLWTAQMFFSSQFRERSDNPVFALLDRLLMAAQSMPRLRKPEP